MLTLCAAHGEPEEESLPAGDQYVDMLLHFQACVRDPQLPLSPGEDGVASACALDALRHAARSGQVRPVAPV